MKTGEKMMLRFAFIFICGFALVKSSFVSDFISGSGSDSNSTTEKTSSSSESSSSSSTTSTTETTSTTTEEEEKEVCFSRLGCFPLESPWKSLLRPIPAPFHPENISTRIYFYSRPNVEKRHFITLRPQISLNDARYDASKPTVIICHGFAANGNATWMNDLKNVYLKNKDANVLLVDWGKGASIWNYLQVAGNTRVVGKELALLVRYLIENQGARPEKFHLIGHSLGAQISSYLAKEVKGIGRLTALDPAQPGFEGFDKQVRLDSSDANFVDVIHTDARPLIPTLGLGMIQPHGHVDFYMNGGYDQPGCIVPEDLPEIKNFVDLLKYPVEVIGKAVACPHGRSYEYLIESLNETEKCIFWGHKASLPTVLKSVTNTVTQGLITKWVALSTNCTKEDCTPLGLKTRESDLRGSFVVTTEGRSPYCISEPGVPPETPESERGNSTESESVLTKLKKKII